MNRRYNPDRRRRRSLRLKGYDYTQAGAYFVTIIVQERLPLFGVVADGKMRLNAVGEMVQRMWGEMPNRFPSIVMDTFITMPNHIHGIITIVGAPLVAAHHPNAMPSPNNAKTPSNAATNIITKPRTTTIPETAVSEDRTTTRVAPTGVQLGAVVGAFKSLTTLEYMQGVRAMNWPRFHGRLWQRNFYEHIVRTDESMERIRQYILDNPAQWAFDRENPMSVSPKQDAP